MTMLSQLKNTHKKARTKKRVGRGPGSGKGKTSSRGMNGFGSRSGYRRRYGDEGGQMRLFAKLPKRGFARGRFIKPVFELNLGDIQRMFNDGDVVNLKAIRDKKCASKKDITFLKILAKGELTKKISIEAHSFSKTALKKLDDKKNSYKEIK